MGERKLLPLDRGGIRYCVGTNSYREGRPVYLHILRYGRGGVAILGGCPQGRLHPSGDLKDHGLLHRFGHGRCCRRGVGRIAGARLLLPRGNMTRVLVRWGGPRAIKHLPPLHLLGPLDFLHPSLILSGQNLLRGRLNIIHKIPKFYRGVLLLPNF